jgi:hypothetical protein
MDGGEDVKPLYLHLADRLSAVSFMHHPVWRPMHENNEKYKLGNYVAALVQSEISHHSFGDRALDSLTEVVDRSRRDRRDTSSFKDIAMSARNSYLHNDSDFPMDQILESAPGDTWKKKIVTQNWLPARPPCCLNTTVLKSFFESAGRVFESFRNLSQVLIREPGPMVRGTISGAAMGHS